MSDTPLYARYNYAAPDNMVFSHYLIEYDIHHANISMLLASGKIDRMMYDFYESIPKQEREIAIGMMIAGEKKDSYEENGTEHSETEIIIKEGIVSAKQQFVEANNIVDEQIVRIANDALLIKTSDPLAITSFVIGSHTIDFKIDGIYTSMVKLADTVILFNSESFVVNVKGISDSRLALCEKFLTAICEIILYMERGDLTVAKLKFHELYEAYINLKLPLEYYRELNSGTGFRIKYNGDLTIPKTARLLALEDKFDKNMLNISYNLYILRSLYNLILFKCG